MTGWRSKKMLTDRDLVDDIIDLRRRLAEAERQRDNAIDLAVSIRKILHELYDKMEAERAKEDK